jgi:hypothetical protein
MTGLKLSVCQFKIQRLVILFIAIKLVVIINLLIIANTNYYLNI